MPLTLHWFRRDFRAQDNTALHAACATHDAAVAVLIIDPRWLGNPAKLGPFQAAFWLESLRELSATLAARNIPLLIRTSPAPAAAVVELARSLHADTITFNKDAEPDQITQDERLERQAAAAGIKVLAFKDASIFEEEELLTSAGAPYSVFTPYKNAYLRRLAAEPPTIRGLPRLMPAAPRATPDPVPTAQDLGYPAVTLDTAPGEAAAHLRLAAFARRGLAKYPATRDLPALSLSGDGTSRLSAHLNAGTLSIRQAFHAAVRGNWAAAEGNVFAAELVWREFYRMSLYNFPHITRRPFNDAYRHVTWQSPPALLHAWQTARTGYPIVDAAMRQLTTTGFMHNRLRMITAMFLTKHLDCHWTLGETFFMQWLVDYDQACNVGGWQWSASTGSDAAPYFRVMNPVLQGQRFDPHGAFVRHFLPALARVPDKFIHAPWTMPPQLQQESRCIIGRDYPAPIVDHATARENAIAKFKRRP